MRLKHVIVHGFKSFARPTKLVFDEPISAIVGPNGSGKSNVIEAIRFALGEQSNKTLRSRATTDLLFKGSDNLRPAKQARVEMVFDNSDRVFSVQRDDNTALPLDFDEVSISRTLHDDGTSIYAINDTSVRLKDIHQLLAGVSVGTSGHHIISQGQADRIVTASPKVRREMVEDALGLKVHQYRLAEAERKLLRATDLLRDVSLQRGELAPQLRHLEQEMKRIAEARQVRSQLSGLYQEYVRQEHHAVQQAIAENAARRQELVTQSEELYRRKQSALEIVRRAQDATLDEELQGLAEQVKALEAALRADSHQVGQIEGRLSGIQASLDALQEQTRAVQPGVKTVPIETVRSFADQIETAVFRLADETSLAAMHAGMRELKTNLQQFWRSLESTKRQTSQSGLGALLGLTNELGRLETDLRRAKDSEANHRRLYEIALERQTEYQRAKRKQEHTYGRAEKDLAAVTAQADRLSDQLSWQDATTQQLSRRQDRLQAEIEEGVVLVGQIIREAAALPPEHVWSDSERETKQRDLERLKLRLEHVGAGGGGEVEQAYQAAKERDEYLAAEMGDTEAAIGSLRTLIRDLHTKIAQEFDGGVAVISTAFHNFFSAMFGGGRASLELVDIPVRGSDGEEETEQGIAIQVKLPNKKVTDIDMLSGGERSLTSIALLFALTQVQPPPFLVLDETDAALDEANSERYGDMLSKLSEHAQLIVVTHNRATMTRAQNLYGITIDPAGSSQMLSIKLEDAVKTAAR